MIRVLHVFGVMDLGGAETMIMNIYDKIDRNEIQFDFVVHSDKAGAYDDSIKSKGGKIVSAPRFRGNNVHRYIAWWNHFFDQNQEYTVLHSHIRSTAALYLPVARKHGVFTIVHSHSISNGGGTLGFVKGVLQFPLRFQADYYMACSKEAGRWLFGTRIISGCRFEIIKNAIELDRFAFDPEKRNQIRRYYNMEKNFVIGHVGRFHRAKNHTFIIEVFREAQKIIPSAKLLLVGDGELRKEIEQRCIACGIDSDVIFAGAKKNVEDYYQAMDAFIFPSLWEGLGMSVVEAQTSGLRCYISENVPGSADINAGLVMRKCISDGAFSWAKTIDHTSLNDREFFVNKAREAGYDIETVAKHMQSEYQRFSNRVKNK